MHKLDRDAAEAPACLDDYSYPEHNWDNLHGCCKKEIRAQLSKIQGRKVPECEEYVINVRCAYCEAEIYDGGHIEHFRRKNRSLGFPELTFSWENLFLSCDSNKNCGHFKDRDGGDAYNPDYLIKPDDIDPDTLLYFHSSGEARPRNKLSPDDKHRAEETIRVFGLNNGALVGARKKAVKSYSKKKKQDFDEIVSWSDNLRQEYFRNEIEETRWDPYATTIRHYLKQLP